MAVNGVALRLLNTSRMTVLMILLGWIAAGVIVELTAAALAPLGYQDETGFHLGQKEARRTENWDCENPS
jgi:hypothetical protein